MSYLRWYLFFFFVFSCGLIATGACTGTNRNTYTSYNVIDSASKVTTNRITTGSRFIAFLAADFCEHLPSPFFGAGQAPNFYASFV